MKKKKPAAKKKSAATKKKSVAAKKKPVERGRRNWKHSRMMANVGEVGGFSENLF
jgi:hypothetical protein